MLKEYWAARRRQPARPPARRAAMSDRAPGLRRRRVEKRHHGAVLLPAAASRVVPLAEEGAPLFFPPGTGEIVCRPGRPLRARRDPVELREVPRRTLAAAGEDGSPVDISPSYLFHHEAAGEMRRLLPDARILFILRNPAEKAFAQYLHLAGAGRETLRFEEALAIEQQRAERGFSDIWLYRSSGYYADALDAMGTCSARGTSPSSTTRNSGAIPTRCCGRSARLPPSTPASGSPPSRTSTAPAAPRSALVATLIGPTALTHLLRRVVPQPLGRASAGPCATGTRGRSPRSTSGPERRCSTGIAPTSGGSRRSSDARAGGRADHGRNGAGRLRRHRDAPVRDDADGADSRAAARTCR